jgi:hypothetical protein
MISMRASESILYLLERKSASLRAETADRHDDDEHAIDDDAVRELRARARPEVPRPPRR